MLRSPCPNSAPNTEQLPVSIPDPVITGGPRDLPTLLKTINKVRCTPSSCFNAVLGGRVYGEGRRLHPALVHVIFIGSDIQLGAGSPGLHSNQVPAQGACPEHLMCLAMQRVGLDTGTGSAVFGHFESSLLLRKMCPLIPQTKVNCTQLSKSPD